MTTTICDQCGASVADEDRHFLWHVRTDGEARGRRRGLLARLRAETGPNGAPVEQK